MIPEVIKRIDTLSYVHEDEELYDMITPHEYGGIVSNDSEPILREKLLNYILSYCNKIKLFFSLSE